MACLFGTPSAVNLVKARSTAGRQDIEFFRSQRSVCRCQELFSCGVGRLVEGGELLLRPLKDDVQLAMAGQSYQKDESSTPAAGTLFTR
jgi:hypothetical protein